MNIVVDSIYLMGSEGSYLCLYNSLTKMFRIGWEAPFFGEEENHEYFFEDITSEEVIEAWAEYLFKTNCFFSYEEAFSRAKNRIDPYLFS